MDLSQFWCLIDSTRGQAERADALTLGLGALPPEQIVRFRLLFDDVLQAANTVDLWGAAHQINGGCTDDGFVYFRERLIELGRDVFDAAVKDPDSLALIVKPGEPMQAEENLASAAMVAWCALTGESEEKFFEAVDVADEKTDRGAIESGVHWDFGDVEEVRERLPRLAAIYGVAN